MLVLDVAVELVEKGGRETLEIRRAREVGIIVRYEALLTAEPGTLAPLPPLPGSTLSPPPLLFDAAEAVTRAWSDNVARFGPLGLGGESAPDATAWVARMELVLADTGCDDGPEAGAGIKPGEVAPAERPRADALGDKTRPVWGCGWLW